MKNITALDFVSKAISKDDTRFNLTGVYRDVDCLVGTDGHRLHWANGQPKIEKGHYLDGRDCEFPQWKQCLPEGTPIKVELPIDSQMVKALKAMKSYLVASGCDKQLSTEFNHSGSHLTILAKFGTYECKMVLPSNAEAPFKLLLNLGYFIDAIELLPQYSRIPVLNGEYYGELKSFILTHSLGKAMIMPLRP